MFYKYTKCLKSREDFRYIFCLGSNFLHVLTNILNFETLKQDNKSKQDFKEIELYRITEICYVEKITTGMYLK